MSWKRITEERTRGQQEFIDTFKKERGEPIPPSKVVPVKGKDPKKKRREDKQRLRRGDFDE